MFCFFTIAVKYSVLQVFGQSGPHELWGQENDCSTWGGGAGERVQSLRLSRNNRTVCEKDPKCSRSVAACQCMNECLEDDPASADGCGSTGRKVVKFSWHCKERDSLGRSIEWEWVRKEGAKPGLFSAGDWGWGCHKGDQSQDGKMCTGFLQ